MTPDDFIKIMLGKPWRRFACGYDACDCYGLVVLYYREVFGIDLGTVPPVGIAEGFKERKASWPDSLPYHGALVMMYNDSGTESHCGVMLPDGMVIHCSGHENQPGNVRISRIKSLEKTYSGIKFYAYNHAA